MPQKAVANGSAGNEEIRMVLNVVEVNEDGHVFATPRKTSTIRRGCIWEGNSEERQADVGGRIGTITTS